MPETYILFFDVDKPYSPADISIATKKCYAQAFAEDIPIFFQCGVSVPLHKILAGRCTEACTAFISTDSMPSVPNIRRLPPGLTVSTYHLGNYYKIESSYMRLVEYCRANDLEIISDSYEFCINDYVTSRNEDEFITKILFYVRKGRSSGAMSTL